MTATLLKKKTETTSQEASMNLKINRKMLFASCEEIPISVFYKITETSNLLLLLRNQQHQESEKLLKSKAVADLLTEVWTEIIDDYWKRSDETKYRLNIRKSVSLSSLKNEYITLSAAVVLAEFGDERGFNYLNYFKKTLITAKQRILVLKTQIALKVTEEIKKENTATKFNLYAEITKIEQIIERNLPDPDSIVLAKWIELNKLASLKIKSLKNGRNK